MRRSWALVVGLGVMAGGAALAACSGSTGPEGPTGPAGAKGDTGATGKTGPAGSAGATADGGVGLPLSATASQGLSISPVPLNLAGLASTEVELIGQGSYLVNAIGDCTGCHTSDPTKFLAGGVAFDGPPSGHPFAVVTSRNLTPDAKTGLPSNVTKLDQFISLMQTGADYHGVAAGGTPKKSLIVMPWAAFRWLSVSDITAIYAYLQVIPAVKNDITADMKDAIPPSTVQTTYTDGDQMTPPALPPAADPDPGYTLRGLALNPLSEVTPPSDPTDQSLFGRGSYLVNALADCNGCHSNPATSTPAVTNIDVAAYLTGGQVFATPPPLAPMVHTVRAASANLLGATNGFFNNPDVGFSTFETLITQGVHAEDPHPAPVAFPMPWQTFSHMQLSDLQAIYVYMNTVATTYGVSTLTGTADKLIPDPAIYCDSKNACPTGMTCSSSKAAGECLADTCAVDTDCAACQTCTTGSCQVMTADALATCMATGY